jgi:hypothetical protein
VRRISLSARRCLRRRAQARIRLGFGGAGWLDRKLQQRRRRLLRTRWRDVAGLLGSTAVSAVLCALAVRHSALLVGLALGVHVGACVVLLRILLAVADGTLLPRLGRLVERAVGADLRHTPGVFAVISDVSFDRLNVDHVVLAPTGCFAVEVKGRFTQHRTIASLPDFSGQADQARDAARMLQSLLRTRGVNLAVTPVLAVAGPAAPHIPDLFRHGDVLITAAGDRRRWPVVLAQGGTDLDAGTAARAAAELRTFRTQRLLYEHSRRR